MKINILFKRITELNYSISEDLVNKNVNFEYENTETKNNLSYLPSLENKNVVVKVKTSVVSKIEDAEFRRLNFEMDVLLELDEFENGDDTEELIKEVHEQYVPLHKILVENITKSITSLDNLPRL